MISPFLQGMIDLVFYEFDDLLPQSQDLACFLVATKARMLPSIVRVRACIRSRSLMNLKAPAYGLFIGILHGIEQHALKIDIGLIHRHRLELELDGTVLDRDLLIYLFQEGYLE